MAEAEGNAVLRISSRNYSSWSMRGWLICRLSGLDFTVEAVSTDDPDTRAELLLQSSSILIPSLRIDSAELWDTLAMAEHLNEVFPKAGLLPREKVARARARSISGEMHGGFQALRSALPMNLRAHIPNFPIWAGVRADITRIMKLWALCLDASGGPFLFGARPGLADAMYAPVVTRFQTYDVKLDGAMAAYARTIRAWPEVVEWTAAAKAEPELHIAELDLEAEF